MTSKEIEAAALGLDPKSRARLAETLLESLESLSASEIAEIWTDEAARRDAELDADPSLGRQSDDVYREARKRLG